MMRYPISITTISLVIYVASTVGAVFYLSSRSEVNPCIIFDIMFNLIVLIVLYKAFKAARAWERCRPLA